MPDQGYGLGLSVKQREKQEKEGFYKMLYKTKALLLLMIISVFCGNGFSQTQDDPEQKTGSILCLNDLQQVYAELDKAKKVRSLTLILKSAANNPLHPIYSQLPLPENNNVSELMVYVERIEERDIANLSKYTSIEEVTFVDCKFTDLGFLSELHRVKDVGFCSTFISDFENISKCTQLEALTIISCRGFSTLSPIVSLPNLKSLEIVDVGLVLSEEFPKLNELEELYLGGNQISNIQYISEFKNLESLTLCDNNIQDVSSLSGLKQLKELVLSGNEIADISPLSGLTELVTLDLSGNRIEDITPIGNCTKMKSLFLDRNSITNIAPLKNCNEITVLSLSGNRIEDISVLSNLTALEILDISCNAIKDCDSLKALGKIYSLTAGNNNISDISFVADLVILRSLSLPNNNIKNINALSFLKNLEYLNLNGNNIGVLNHEIQMRANRFHKEARYEDLTWLEQNWLAKGMMRSDIVAILGDNFCRMNPQCDVVNIDVHEEETETWIYSSNRDVPYGAQLVIHFTSKEEVATVESWEWSSE